MLASGQRHECMALIVCQCSSLWYQLVVHCTGEAGVEVEGAGRAGVDEAVGEGLAEGLEGAGEALAASGETV